MSTTFLGYRRGNAVGIRNMVAVISVMDNCNPVTRAVADAVQGTVYLPGSFIRGQLGRDRAITLKVTAGLCLNPNIAAVVAIGLEPRTTRELVELLSASGKPVEWVDIQEAGGTINSIAKGTRAAARLVRHVSKQRREEFPLSSLVLGLECGGSNPTPDNIRGGLTTIEEKALGAMAKAGKSELVGVLGYGDVPERSGLHFMSGPAPAVESITGLAAGGCQLCLFSTGVGNPIGHQVATVIKISGNRNTIEGMSDNVDFDVSSILEKDESIASAGSRLFEYVLSVASGELTTSEILDTRESAISRFGPSM